MFLSGLFTGNLSGCPLKLPASLRGSSRSVCACPFSFNKFLVNSVCVIFIVLMK